MTDALALETVLLRLKLKRCDGLRVSRRRAEGPEAEELPAGLGPSKDMRGGFLVSMSIFSLHQLIKDKWYFGGGTCLRSANAAPKIQTSKEGRKGFQIGEQNTRPKLSATHDYHVLLVWKRRDD